MSVFKRFRRHRVGFIDKHVDRDPGNAACIHQNVTKRLDKSMLGYDWIAGMLDNEQQIEDLSDEFFQDISKFRRENQMACKTYLPLKRNRFVITLYQSIFASNHSQKSARVHHWLQKFRKQTSSITQIVIPLPVKGTVMQI